MDTDDRADPCAERLKVLADRNRLSVLRALLAGPRLAGELAEILGIEGSLLSHHLRVLREAGLVVVEKSGRHRAYGLSPEVRSGGPALDLGCCRLDFTDSGGAA